MKKVIKRAKSPKNIKSVVPQVGEDCILVIKVGTDDRPAGTEDIHDIAIAIDKLRDDPHGVLVTHHAVDFVAFPRRLLGNVAVK